MSEFLSFISDIKVVIAIAVAVLLLAVWLIVEKARTRKYRRELEGLEKRYNDLKSVPLSFKMNKAVAIGRINHEMQGKVDEAKDSFDKTEASIKKISDNLADCEDQILVGKLRKADDLMMTLEHDISLTEKDVKDLNSELDQLLSRETAQRQEVTDLKNRFRALKSQAQENASKLSYNWPAVEQKITDTEKMFSTFEEWMFSSDFDKANGELESIQKSMNELNDMIETLPSLLEDARGVIPNMAEELHHDYTRNKNRGVYLKHLDVENNLNVLTESLNGDLNKLKQGRSDGVREHLEMYKSRLMQMDAAVKKEGNAYDEMRKLATETNRLADETNENARFVQNAFTDDSDKYGLKPMSDEINGDLTELKDLNGKKPVVMQTVRAYNTPASQVLNGLNELNQKYASVNESLEKMRAKIETATGDEDRARKQLIKLQIIMNQMQVKIRKYKLPNISETYEDDMNRANEYIHSLENLMDEKPINMQLLTATLQEALDFIYKLYNNVNNVVGTVVMVENTIVFGNRYRSTYPDIDSELTRSELCFRNGEYTQALTIAIATIEKIHPGNYESMIKENAKGAE